MLSAEQADRDDPRPLLAAVGACIDSRFLERRDLSLKQLIHAHIFLFDEEKKRAHWVSSGVGSQSLRADRKGLLTVNDCHAENLAIKAFRAFLWSSVARPEPFFTASESRVFAQNPAKPRTDRRERAENDSALRLKDKFRVFMCVSRAPCGMASTRDGELVTKSHPLSQAKAVKAGMSWEEAESVILPGKARIKPVRRDAPASCVSLTLLCTDKLYRSQYHGIQGNFLSHIYASLRISTLFVPEGEEQTSFMQKAFHRSLPDEGIFELNGKSFHAFSFNPIRLRSLPPEGDGSEVAQSSIAFGVYFCAEEGDYCSQFVSPKTGLREGAIRRDFENVQCASVFSAFAAHQKLKSHLRARPKALKLAEKLGLDLDSIPSTKMLAIPYYCISTRLKGLLQ